MKVRVSRTPEWNVLIAHVPDYMVCIRVVFTTAMPRCVSFHVTTLSYQLLVFSKYLNLQCLILLA